MVMPSSKDDTILRLRKPNRQSFRSTPTCVVRSKTNSLKLQVFGKEEFPFCR